MYDLPKLSQDACPSLVSVKCALSAFPCLPTNKNIIGYKTTRVDRLLPLQLDAASTAQVKYLSVKRYTPDSPFLCIILLEITSWNIEVRRNAGVLTCPHRTNAPIYQQTIRNFADLPELRTLALCRSTAAPDITSEYSARLSVVVEACKRCPSLDRILHTSNSENPYERHYSEFSITRSLVRDHGLKIIHREVHRVVEMGDFWWDAYDVV
jgi:hypothetical protein